MNVAGYLIAGILVLALIAPKIFGEWLAKIVNAYEAARSEPPQAPSG